MKGLMEWRCWIVDQEEVGRVKIRWGFDREDVKKQKQPAEVPKTESV